MMIKSWVVSFPPCYLTSYRVRLNLVVLNPDGKLLVFTPVDPLFLLLPIMSAVAPAVRRLND